MMDNFEFNLVFYFGEEEGIEESEEFTNDYERRSVRVNRDGKKLRGKDSGTHALPGCEKEEGVSLANMAELGHYHFKRSWWPAGEDRTEQAAGPYSLRADQSHSSGFVRSNLSMISQPGNPPGTINKNLSSFENLSDPKNLV